MRFSSVASPRAHGGEATLENLIHEVSL